MRTWLLIILITAGTCRTFAQASLPDVNTWDKILIFDSKSGWRSWHHAYQIERSTMNLTFLNKPDSIIKAVDPELIRELFASFSNEAGYEEDPLLLFGKDSTWLISNAADLWAEFQGEEEVHTDIDSLAVNILRDYARIKPIVRQLQGEGWIYDSPISQISVITKEDTLSFTGAGGYPFMHPWQGNGSVVCNYRLPVTIGKLLPDSIQSNKARLMGSGFEQVLVEEAYDWYIAYAAELAHARRKYRLGFKRIERHFTIESATISMMGSIEWGGFVAANCLELVVKDTAVADNILFSTVFGRRILPHSLGPIIRKEKKLIKRLAGNPVYNYCLQHKTCTGEIHLVNHKSLSGQAKRNFKTDLKDSGQDKSQYRFQYRKAVFFELTEIRDGTKSFSRWIMLKNGTIVLWQFTGSYLMDVKGLLPNGYICKRMDRAVFGVTAK